MALSMFGANVFAAGTTDYTDDAELTYGSQAVAVMSELGIINGMGDGSFNPSGDYTRVQAAKVLTYMLATPEVAAKLDAPAKDVFADVPADFWGAAYVAYAVDKKIIAGYGDGTFGPDDALTRDQWLKMLLVALGKDPVKEGLIGDNYETRAAALAMRTFITPADYELEWNRETAVYYAFKALTGYEVNGKTLAEKIYNMTQTVKYDDFGAPVSFTLTNGKSASSAYYKEYATVEIYADYDWSDDVTELAKVENYDETTWKVFVDGKEVKDAATVGGKSCDVKVYKEADHTYRVIVKENYFDVATKNEYTEGFYLDPEGVKYPGAKLAAVPQTVTKKDTKTGAIELDNEAITFANQASKYIKDTCVGVKYDVYYDSYGNVIAMDDFHPYAPEAELVYVYDSIVTAEPVYSGTGFDKIIGKEYTAQAKVMHMDGTIETVDVALANVGPETYVVNKYGYAGEMPKTADGSLINPVYFEGDINLSREFVPIFSTDKVWKVELYDVDDEVQDGPYGNFYNMYTFEDGTVTLEGTNCVECGEVAGPLANDVDQLATLVAGKETRYVEGISEANGPFANGSTKIHVITIDPAGDKIVADGEVTLDATGNKNFQPAEYVDGYYVLNAAGTVITDIYAIALKNNVTYSYGIYLGTTVETIEEGLHYEFGLSDGTTAEYTAAAPNPANFIGGLKNGDVYKVKFEKGKMVDAMPLTIATEGYAVENDGYFVVLAEENVQVDYAPDFGGMAWGAPEGKLVAVKPATFESNPAGDYLVLWTDNGSPVVFATTKYDKTETFVIDGVYNGKQKFVMDETDDDFATMQEDHVINANGRIDVDPECEVYFAHEEQISLPDYLYEGKTFTFTYEKFTRADGWVEYTLISAKTADKYTSVIGNLSDYSYENGVATIKIDLDETAFTAANTTPVVFGEDEFELKEVVNTIIKVGVELRTEVEMVVKNDSEIQVIIVTDPVPMLPLVGLG